MKFAKLNHFFCVSAIEDFYDALKSLLFRSRLKHRNDQLQRITECVKNGPGNSIVNSFTDYIYATVVLVYGKDINVNAKQNIK